MNGAALAGGVAVASGLLLVFGAFAAVVFLGVLAHNFFTRTGFPDVLVLMGLGFLAGPILGLVDPEPLSGAAPILGSFVLLVILLEGGLELNYRHVVAKARNATLLTLGSIAATAALVALLARVAGLPFWPHGLLMGFVVAPLSASVLVPMLSRLPVQPQTRAVLGLETTLGEAVAVVAVFVLVEAAVPGALQPEEVGAQVSSTLVVGVVGALLGGLIWLEALRVLGRTPYNYMVTLAAAVALFVAIQWLGGNGYVGVLVFGMVLGNARAISDHLPRFLRTEVRLDDAVRWMNTEVTFLLRTFFFLYLGLVLDPADFTAGSLGLAAIVLGGIVVARVATVGVLVRIDPSERADADALLVLQARGLATAVLAAAATPVAERLGGAEAFAEVASVLIVLTNLLMAAGTVVLRRRKRASLDQVASEPSLASGDF